MVTEGTHLRTNSEGEPTSTRYHRVARNYLAAFRWHSGLRWSWGSGACGVLVIPRHLISTSAVGTPRRFPAVAKFGRGCSRSGHPANSLGVLMRLSLTLD